MRSNALTPQEFQTQPQAKTTRVSRTPPPPWDSPLFILGRATSPTNVPASPRSKRVRHLRLSSPNPTKLFANQLQHSGRVSGVGHDAAKANQRSPTHNITSPFRATSPVLLPHSCMCILSPWPQFPKHPTANPVSRNSSIGPPLTSRATKRAKPIAFFSSTVRPRTPTALPNSTSAIEHGRTR